MHRNTITRSQIVMLKDIKSNRPQTWLKVVILRFKTWLVWHLTFFLAWQTAERVSVRLAARGTALEAPQVQQDSRYQHSSYGQPPAPMYTTTPYPQQPPAPHNHQHPQQPFMAAQPHSGKQTSNKRQLPEEEAESAPPKKRAKAKPRTTGPDGTPGTCSPCIFSIYRHALTPERAAFSFSLGPSKRGYNARRRLEAAHIAAQNGMHFPFVLVR